MRRFVKPVVLGLTVVALVAAAVAWRQQALRRQAHARAVWHGSAYQPPPPEWQSPANPPAPAIPTALNTFGFTLFQDMWRREPNNNLMVSPMSLWFALAMVYNGAAGQTRTAMQQTLQLGDMSLGDLDFGCQKLARSLQLTPGDPQLLAANSLWLDERWPFKPGYVGLCREFFGSLVYPLKLDSATAPPFMNAWVAQNTFGRITEIITPEDLRGRSGPIVLVVLDTLYFKGSWAHWFTSTSEADFTRADGSRVRAPLMAETESWYHYYEDAGCQLISLPYGSGRTSMYVLLPKEVAGLPGYCQRLTAESWGQYVAAMQFRAGTIMLPRFELGFGRDLNQHLGDLGMGVAFTQQADFSEMSPGGIWLEWVRQKVWLQVNEAGTEVAVVTAAGGAGGPPPPKPEAPFEMVVDHPFLFAIRDNATGVILVMGVVMDPTRGG